MSAYLSVSEGRMIVQEEAVQAASSAGSRADRTAASSLPAVSSCQADGCRADISKLSSYHQRCRICEEHLKADDFLRYIDILSSLLSSAMPGGQSSWGKHHLQDGHHLYAGPPVSSGAAQSRVVQRLLMQLTHAAECCFCEERPHTPYLQSSCYLRSAHGASVSCNGYISAAYVGAGCLQDHLQSQFTYSHIVS